MEAALLVLEADGDAEGGPELAAVVGRDFPVEKGRAPSVDLLVPELDFIAGHTVVEEKEEKGCGVLPAGEADDIAVVAMQVEVGHLF